MVINNLMDLIKKLFGDNYENVIIIDASIELNTMQML